MNRQSRTLSTLLWLILSAPALGGAYELSEPLMSELESLPPLPKPHLVVGGHGHLAWFNQRVMTAYVRITGVIDLDANRGLYGYQADMARAVHQDVPDAVAALHLSPFFIEGKLLTPKLGRSRCGDPRLPFRAWPRDVERMRASLSGAKAKLAGVPIRYVTLDYESWEMFADDGTDVAEVHAAVLRWLLAYDQVVRQTLPGVLVIWEQQGEIRRHPGRGWTERQVYPHQGYGLLGPFSCAWFAPWSVEGCRETLRRTCTNADAYGVEDVWVILSLGVSARPLKGRGEFHSWNFADGYRYDPVFAWRLGAELNDPWFAAPNPGHTLTETPYHRVPGVLLEPTPLSHHKTTGRPYTWRIRHFIEYVKGANGIE